MAGAGVGKTSASRPAQRADRPLQEGDNPAMSLYFPTPDECSRHTIFPGVQIRTCAAEKMMLSFVEMEPHAVVEEHAHPHEQVGILLKGRATFYVGGEEKTLGPGDMWRIPGGTRHRVVVLDEPVQALDIFTPPREDYL